MPFVIYQSPASGRNCVPVDRTPAAQSGWGRWSGAGSNCRPHAFQRRQTVSVRIHCRPYLRVRAMIGSAADRPDVQQFAQLAANLAARLKPVPRCPVGFTRGAAHGARRDKQGAVHVGRGELLTGLWTARRKQLANQRRRRRGGAGRGRRTRVEVGTWASAACRAGARRARGRCAGAWTTADRHRPVSGYVGEHGS
jgi:hypothetical protein